MQHNRVFLIALAIMALATVASTFTVAPLKLVSGPSPFAGCTIGATGVGFEVMYENAEEEPWVEVNPTNPNNIIAVWQQDRWSNGGSRGLVVGVSFNAGVDFTQVMVLGLSACSGGNYKRATDPWISFSPDGTLHLISDSFDPDLAG